MYRAAGWHGVLPVGNGPGQKFPPPRAFTGHGSPDPSGADVAAYVETHGDRNIALRLPPGVIGLDVDAYGAKSGRVTLSNLIAKFGALPPTWVTSARTDGTSGIRLYRVPTHLDGAEINWPGEAGPNIEIIQHGHRYALVWPSVNPEAGGAMYVWRWGAQPVGHLPGEVPLVSDLPELPEAWVRGLALDRARVDKADLGTHELRSWWEALRDGDLCPVIDRLTRDTVYALHASAGSRHETARDAAAAVARFGGEGHRGAGRALARIGVTFDQAVGVERATNGEWRRLLAGAVKLAAAAHPVPLQRCACDPPPDVAFAPEVMPDFQRAAPGSGSGLLTPVAAPASLTLPAEFWAARPSLARIRQAAHSRVRSGDVVFYGTLVRIAAMAPHWLRLDTGIGSRGCLNLFTAIVGPSGAGKTSGLSVARDLYPVTEDIDEVPLGSGEGLAEAYMGMASVETGEMRADGSAKVEKRRTQVRHNVLAHTDEGASLNKMLERRGATVGETLRSAWSGETIGQRNGRDDTTRIVRAGEYSLGLMMGYQPETVMPLLADVAAGTPQRFLYAWATDPTIPAEAVEWPGAGTNPFPPDVRSSAAQGVSPFADPAGPIRTPVTFAPAILRELRAEAIARGRGEVVVDPYQSQRPMMHVKVATLVAALDGGRRHVDDEDWQLAEVVLGTSDGVREYLVERARDASAREYARETEALSSRAVHAAAALRAFEAGETDRATARVAASLARRVHAAEHEGTGTPVHRGELRRMLPSRDRGRYDDAVALAAELGWLVGDDVGGWKPGPSAPAA